MPESFGHAKDFFINNLKDGQKNKKRDLTQYTNPSNSNPKVDDLLIFVGTTLNKYGHVAIISKVTGNEVEIIQQNSGPFNKSRETFSLDNKDGKQEIKTNEFWDGYGKNNTSQTKNHERQQHQQEIRNPVVK